MTSEENQEALKSIGEYTFDVCCDSGKIKQLDSYKVLKKAIDDLEVYKRAFHIVCDRLSVHECVALLVKTVYCKNKCAECLETNWLNEARKELKNENTN